MSRIVILIIAVFGAAFLSGCATQKEQQEASLHLRIGTALLEQGKYPNALKELLEAEKLDSRSALIQNNLGLAYFLREKYELAVQHLTRAVELDAKYTEARNNRARALIELGRYDDAIAELDKVLADLTYTDPTKAWINMGLANFRKRSFSKAKENFAEAIKLSRDNCLAQTMFGRSLFELGQIQSASQTLDNAVVICRASKFDEPYYFSGLSYYKQGNAPAAIGRMEELVKNFPDSKYAHKAESLLKLMK